TLKKTPDPYYMSYLSFPDNTVKTNLKNIYYSDSFFCSYLENQEDIKYIKLKPITNKGQFWEIVYTGFIEGNSEFNQKIYQDRYIGFIRSFDNGDIRGLTESFAP
ncbi:MAG: hypothetical protein ACRCV0_04150, partial [Brevinema sp.]